VGNMTDDNTLRGRTKPYTCLEAALHGNADSTATGGLFDGGQRPTAWYHDNTVLLWHRARCAVQ